MRHACGLVAALLFLCLPAACSAAGDASTALVEWRDVTDQDLSPLGRLAMSPDDPEWLHAETEHFVHHFRDAEQARTVVVNAEVYYRWIKELFGVSEDRWRKKAHVFVFHEPERWKAFSEKTGPGPHAGAFTNGWELFLMRDPFWLAPMKTTAHEVAHLILFRFLDGPAPLFLNEGFAEFVSYRALAMQQGRSEFEIRTVQLVPPDKYVPLRQLAAATRYPEDVETFYVESELLVRYLALYAGDGATFYALLKRVSAGESFERTYEDLYDAGFDALETSFHAFATTGKAPAEP